MALTRSLMLTHWGETNGRHFANDIFKCIFLNEYVRFLNKISLKFVPKGLMNNIPALVQIMAWHRLGDKPLSELVMFSLPTHICVTRPQWVKDAILSEKAITLCRSDNHDIMLSAQWKWNEVSIQISLNILLKFQQIVCILRGMPGDTCFH